MDKTTQPESAAFGALGLLTLIWGYNWVMLKIGLAYSGPFAFAAARCALGCLCLFAVLVVARKPLRPTRVRAALLLGLFQTTLFIGLICAALVQGGAGKSAILAYTMPFWVILLAPFVLGERLTRSQWLAVGAALLGLLFIFSPWQRMPDLYSGLLALASGVAWAVSVLIAKKTPTDGPWDLLSLTAWQALFGSLPLLLLAWLVPERSVAFSGAYVLTLLYNAVLGTALGWLLWLFAVGRLSATVSGLVSLTTPVVGVLASWWQLDERPTFSVSVGMTLVLAALALVSLGARRKA